MTGHDVKLWNHEMLKNQFAEEISERSGVLVLYYLKYMYMYFLLWKAEIWNL